MYEVAYAIETPWTHPPRVTATRKVTIVDVNECALVSGPCVQRCAAEASCVNAIGSGYSCACPKGTKGDGFLQGAPPGAAPVGFVNGSGCVDATPPVVSLARAKHEITLVRGANASLEVADLAGTGGGLCGLAAGDPCATAKTSRGDPLTVSASISETGMDRYVVTYEAADKVGNVGAATLAVSIKWLSLRDFMQAASPCPVCPKARQTRTEAMQATRTATTRASSTATTSAPPSCVAACFLFVRVTAPRRKRRARPYRALPQASARDSDSETAPPKELPPRG